MRILRDDQDGLIEEIRDAIRVGKRRIMVQAPTGYGKTVVLAQITANAIARGKKALTTVPTIELVDQTIEMLWAQGVKDVGVMQATHDLTDWRQPVQVASVQTLLRRMLPEADFAIVDEAHKWFRYYEKWFMQEDWRNKPIIGLSATPWTKGLGRYYDELIIAGTTEDMIERGLLSPFRPFAPTSPDLKGVRTVAGDYHEADLATRVNTAPLVADIVQTWLKLGENRSTLCFAVDRAHAKHLQQQFAAAGVSAGYVDAFTKGQERRELKEAFQGGSVKVVCNVGVLTTGVDWDVRCIIFARPTKSKMLFVQMAGRGLRTAEGKDYCLFLDHSDNHQRLGFVSDIHQDHLDDGKTKTAAKQEGIRLPKPCPQCKYLKPPKTAKCPQCGFVAQAFSAVETQDGELRELKKKPKAEKVLRNRFPNAAVTLGQLRYFAQWKNYSSGWASHKYREIYGLWPTPEVQIEASKFNEPLEEDLARWVKSQQIRWAHRRARGEAGIPTSEHGPEAREAR